MNRSFPVVLVLCVLLSGITRADEPKPPWQRLLTGDDARKADELARRAAEREAADQYAEVIRLGEELLALRTKVQGADHWQTIDVKWVLVSWKKVAALPEAKRTEWRQLAQSLVEAGRLERTAQYAKALRLWQEALKGFQEVLGDDHPDTAACYNRIAYNLNAQGKLAEAGPLFQKALSIRRQTLGEDHPDTGTSYNNVAYNLHAQGRYPQAQLLFQKALAIHRQVLGEEHKETALSYNNLAGNLDVQGKHAEAGLLYLKALDIYRQVLGEDQPQTAASYNNLASNLDKQGKYAEAETLHRKALGIWRQALGETHPNTAISYNNLAANLDAQGKYAEAGPLYQKALDSFRKALGEDHPITATGYDNVAANLAAQGQYAEAAPLYQKALDIRRKMLGEDHPDTATSYNNLAANRKAQGKYAEAAPLFQKALDICRQSLGEIHAQTALCYNNLASNLTDQGRYAEAGPLYQKALAIYRQTLGENHPETARSYHNVAFNLDHQGQHAEAEPLYQKALAIRRQTLGEDHPDTALTYNNLAGNLADQGKPAEAGALYQKALDIRRKILGENHPDTAESYNNLAMTLQAQGKHAEAALLLQKALDIYRQALGEDHPSTAASYNNLASNLEAQGKVAEAESVHRKALARWRKVVGETHEDTITGYNNLAYNLYTQGKYPEALTTLEAAVRSYESARLSVSATGLERAAFGVNRSPYAFLAAVRSRRGSNADAWEALEADLARGLLDEQARRQSLALSPDEQRQRDDLRARRAPLEAQILALVGKRQRTDTDAAELERLIEQRQRLEQALTDLAVRMSRRQVATLAQLQAALPANTAFVAWIDVADEVLGVQEHWGCVVRPQGEPHWERLPGSGPGGTWTSADSELRRQFWALLARQGSAAELDPVARKLHAQRLAPLSKHLEGVKHLFVVPAHWMAGLPVETLTDQYTVSYTPSGTYLVRLKARPQPGGTGLLAVGDPVFPSRRPFPPSTALPPGGLLITQVLPDSPAAVARLHAGDVLVAYAGEDLTSVEQFGKLLAAKSREKTVLVAVWREGQEKVAEREVASGRLGVILAKEPARQVISARRQADQLLAEATRGAQFAELPGTQVEIARLAELFDPQAVTTLTRADASEQRLDELRRGGTLKQFRYLHFATHGQANSRRAFDSALLLTPPARLPDVRVGEPYLDGRLTAAEVQEYWQLDAELVTLSACESGLGKHGGGDGILGFAQAFLLTGSRSVCLSLWQVDDTATALLMDRFYRNLLGKRADGVKPMGKAAALREAKEWLRTLSTSEALERLGTLTQGVVRGERPAREEMQAVPLPKDAPRDYRPYAHPRYWAAFILLGDAE